MKLKSKLLAGAVLFSLATAMPVLAAPTVEIDKNYSTGEIYVNVNEEESGRYTAILLKGNIKTEELLSSISDSDIEIQNEITNYNPGELLGYAGEFSSNQELVIEMKTTGNYTLYIASKVTGDKYSYPITITSKTDYQNAIDALNDGIDNKDEFYSAVLNNKDKLGFDGELAEGQNLKDITDLMFNEINGEALSSSEYEKHTLLYKYCLTLDMLNKGTITDEATNIIEDIINADSLMLGYYNKHITDQTRKDFMFSNLKEKSIASTEDLKLKVRDAIILAVVKYPDGYMNIRTILDSYKNELGISITDKTTVYQNLATNTYGSVTLLLDEYKRLSEPTIQGGGGSGGGGSSGGSGSGGSSGGSGSGGKGSISGSPNGGSIGLVPTDGGIANEIKMPFADLDTVEWAYEAISALSNAKIVSGKSETSFAPRDKVKREEFVKMLIGALGEEQFSSGETFDDVPTNAWYNGYVGKAYDLKIVNGISDKLFGTGLNISRQDMAVMIYKALLVKDIKFEKSELAFSDGESISEYAKEAVAALNKAGIINGQDNNIFNPLGEATRAEAAQMIYGIYKILK